MFYRGGQLEATLFKDSVNVFILNATNILSDASMSSYLRDPLKIEGLEKSEFERLEKERGWVELSFGIQKKTMQFITGYPG